MKLPRLLGVSQNRLAERVTPDSPLPIENSPEGMSVSFMPIELVICLDGAAFVVPPVGFGSAGVVTYQIDISPLSSPPARATVGQ